MHILLFALILIVFAALHASEEREARRRSAERKYERWRRRTLNIRSTNASMYGSAEPPRRPKKGAAR